MPNFYDETTAKLLHSEVRRGPVMQDSVVITPADVVFYERRMANVLNGAFSTRKDWLTGYGLDNNASVLVVGCGFGFLMEELIAAGITDVWGIEPGSWYWDAANDGEWATGIDNGQGVSLTMKARVANDWLGSGTEQASLEAIGAGNVQEKFDWILDEDAATVHSDAELPAFIAACEARLQGNARGRIVHLVTTYNGQGTQTNPLVNWKTLAEWKAVAPNHNWVDINSGEVA